MLGQSQLIDAAHARAVAASNSSPLIDRFETWNSGALSGGHEVSFVVNGTAGAKASIPLLEEKSGQYTGNYPIEPAFKVGNKVRPSGETLVANE